MLSVRNLSFQYSGNTRKSLEAVTLDLPADTITAVVGLSGAGKTTLLNLLGLLWDGAVEAEHMVYTDASDKVFDYLNRSAHRWDEVRLREFGFVMQSAHMLPHFTCRENIAMPLALQGVPYPERRRRVARLLYAADPSGELHRLRDRLANQVSGGQRQRMAVLRALVHNPRIVFADEPLSNLDPLNAQRTLDLLLRWKTGRLGARYNNGRCLVLVTHDVSLAWRYADRFAILRDGRLVGGEVALHSDLIPGGGESEIRRRMGC